MRFFFIFCLCLLLQHSFQSIHETIYEIAFGAGGMSDVEGANMGKREHILSISSARPSGAQCALCTEQGRIKKINKNKDIYQATGVHVNFILLM